VPVREDALGQGGVVGRERNNHRRSIFNHALDQLRIDVVPSKHNCAAAKIGVVGWRGREMMERSLRGCYARAPASRSLKCQ
jgi:hypothetical protein